eukprot:SAG31_NODE_2624_length_5360_cov_2.184946_2_plen_104_part_00
MVVVDLLGCTMQSDTARRRRHRATQNVPSQRSPPLETACLTTQGLLTLLARHASWANAIVVPLVEHAPLAMASVLPVVLVNPVVLVVPVVIVVPVVPVVPVVR